VSGGVANLRPRPFPAGHDLSVTHGAYRQLENFNEEELAEYEGRKHRLRELSPLYTPQLEPFVETGALWAMALARAGVDIVRNTVRKGGQPAPVAKRAEAWTRLYWTALSKLGIDEAEGLHLTVDELRRLPTADLQALQAIEQRAKGRS
jgi:hypothetical protein